MTNKLNRTGQENSLTFKPFACLTFSLSAIILGELTAKEFSLNQAFDMFFIINLENNLINLSRRGFFEFHWPYPGIQEGRERNRNEIVFKLAAVGS